MSRAIIPKRSQGRYLEKRGFINITQRQYYDGIGVYYECPKCGENFATYKRLKKHRKDVHAY